MKGIANMRKEKLTIYLDLEFKEFMNHLKETKGVTISSAMQIATKEKFANEYEQFLKQKKASE
ncbi:hypothetical protein LJB89_04655 [Tyzzerella sp. OttesenSCG-928-J15]|nr:hypothetical protein [Tyzzerella sp. OttesenSCG-928-J15]